MPPGNRNPPARNGAAPKKSVVLHFASTHDTILAERLATQRGCDAEVIPRPPGKTGRCGVALQVAAADLEALTGIFVRGGLADFDVAEG
jgi:hypothetical protein